MNIVTAGNFFLPPWICPEEAWCKTIRRLMPPLKSRPNAQGCHEIHLDVLTHYLRLIRRQRFTWPLQHLQPGGPGVFHHGHKGSCLASIRPVDARYRLEAYATINGCAVDLVARLDASSAPPPRRLCLVRAIPSCRRPALKRRAKSICPSRRLFGRVLICL